MELTSISFALVAFFTACACAAALPDLSATGKYALSIRTKNGELTYAADIAKRAGNATEPTLDPQVLSNLSSWFGWQLAGGAKDANELVDGCRDLDSIGGTKWAQIGLVPANIRRESRDPSCPDHSLASVLTLG